MSKMLINGRFLCRNPTGVDRFATELLGSVQRAIHPRLSFEIAVPRGATLRPSDILSTHSVVECGMGSGQAWEQFSLPLLARGRPLINLANSAPIAMRSQLVVIHDAATLVNPANFSRAFRTWYRLMLGGLMRSAKVVATVSKFSASELARTLGKRASGIELISEGGEHILRQAADTSVLARLGIAGRRYVLAVGSSSPNKNFSAVLRAMQILDDPDLLLVAAGGSNARVFGDAQVSDERLIRAGYVSDAELRALYEHATCFVFPSFYEGFGLSPLEAMWCGCPVVVSNTSSLPEVCGEAALYCDPADPATLAKQMRSVLTSGATRAELREAGLTRAALFSWKRAAESFSEIVRRNF